MVTSTERTNRWRAAHPERIKLQARKTQLKQYGLTPEDYKTLLEKQNGLCAICGKTQERKKKNGEPYSLAVDHRHDNQRVRGLLCDNCNLHLGWLDNHSDSILEYWFEVDRINEDNERRGRG